MAENLKSPEDMRKILESSESKSEADFHVGQVIRPMNRMDQGNYSYTLEAPIGQQFDPRFDPYFTPQEMLTIGVFEGKYLNDCLLEFPREWYLSALEAGNLSPGYSDINCNYFKIKSRMSLQNWIEQGWIPIIPGDPDNRGWFQWYARYYLGRRIPDLDYKQISRWRSFKRHYGQVKKNCPTLDCRPKQRQALLQWSYNAFVTPDDPM